MKKPKKKAPKDEVLHVRVTSEQKAVFVKTAAEVGASLSTWVVSTCLQAVRT